MRVGKRRGCNIVTWPVAQQTAVEQHLRHLRRLPRTGRRGEHQPFLCRQSIAQPCSISQIGKSTFSINQKL